MALPENPFFNIADNPLFFSLMRRRLFLKAFTLAVIILVLIAPPVFAKTKKAKRSPKIQKTSGSPSSLKKLSLEELMNLDVTSVAKQPEPFGQAPAAIQVITNDEIRRSGASSIPEALRLADNLNVAKKASHNWAISARGFNTDSANKLLVLMDGRSVYTPLFSGVFWDVQDYLLEDIDRIEVISGPGGTLWGSNAVNGVINITSKSAKDTKGFYMEAGMGSQLLGFTGVRYGWNLAPDIHFRVYGKYSDYDGEIFPDGTPAPDSWRVGQGGFRLDTEPTEGNTFTLQGDLYQGDEFLTTGGDAGVSGGNLLGRWSRAFSDDSNMSLQLYFDRTHLYDPVPANAFAPAGILIDDLDTYDLDFQHRFHLGGNNSLVWGVGYRFTQDRVQSAPALAFDPAVLEHHLFSGFAQDKITLAERWFLTLGAKVEHNDYTGFEFEPNGRIQWNVTDKQMLWGAVSRAIRAPSRVDRDIRLPTPYFSPFVDDLLVGGAGFISETLIAYELGYRASFGPDFSSSLSVFYNDYDDIRSTSLSPPNGYGFPFPLFYENNLTGQTYGFEWTLDYQLSDRWRLHGGYDLLEEYIHVKPGQMDFNNALNETADPKQRYFLRSAVDFPNDVEWDIGLNWQDPFVFNNAGVPNTVPGYVELEMRLGWRPDKNLELSLVGENLLHDHHLEYVISNPNPREEIQRSVRGKVTWKF